MRKLTPRPMVTAALLAVAGTGGTLIFVPAARAAVTAARPGHEPRLSIASPATGNLVAGLVPVAVAFDAGAAGRVTLIELWVDDLLYLSQTVDQADPRGTQSIDWDTQRLRNGQHSLKVRAFCGHKLIAADSALVTVSNGGVDVVPPLISFYAPLDGQTVSGTVNIGVNATDNDQVSLVGLFVNRQLRMMKSNPPFQYSLDTTTLPLLNGRGSLVLEAWAYDRAQNRGVAKPITVFVHNPINATPLQPDPKAPKGHPAPPPADVKPAPPQETRLSPLAALTPPAASPVPSAEVKTPVPAAPPAPQAAVQHPVGTPAHTAAPRPIRVALVPKPHSETRLSVPAKTHPARSAGVVRPRPVAAQLEVALTPAPAAQPTVDGPRTVVPSRTRPDRHRRGALQPAAIAVKPVRVGRLPEPDLVAIPLAPRPSDPPAATRPKPTKPAPRAKIALAPPPELPRPVAAAARTTPVIPPAAHPAARAHQRKPQQGSNPDRIVLPVYRLARLPESPNQNRTYTVKRGDTLSRIARQHGVTPRSILVANGLTRAAEVAPGERLSIPGTFTIAYNDQPVGFDVQPRVEGGMAIAPFRQLFEHTGGVVHYQPTDREVHALSPDKEIHIKIGSREALVNSAVVLMDRAAFLDTGRTMVPVKFMTEALDLKAEYDLRTGAIYLVRK